MFNVDIIIEIFIIILTNAYGSAYKLKVFKKFWGDYFAAKTR